MNISELNVDTTSQHISESYFHLSQDDPPSDSVSSVESINGDESYCNISKLLRLAGALDSNPSDLYLAEEKGKKDELNQDRKESKKTLTNKFLSPESPQISSHSTPIMPKNHSLKFDMLSDLSQINERNELENQNPSNKPSEPTNIPQISSGSDNAYDPVFSLLSKDINELNDIKKVVDFVIKQKSQKSDGTQRSSQKLFTTPIRYQFQNEANKRTEESDENDSSIKSDLRKDMESQEDRDSISPITTPPRSQEMFETLNKTQLTEFDGDTDTSYVPKWARNPSTDKNMIELDKTDDLNKIVSQLRKEMDDLKNKTMDLQKENNDLRANIQNINSKALASQDLSYETEPESKLEKEINHINMENEMNQLNQKIVVLVSSNNQMKTSLDEIQEQNKELKSEINHLNEKLKVYELRDTPETIQNVEQSTQTNNNNDNLDYILSQNGSNANCSNNTVIGEGSIEDLTNKSELSRLYDLINEKDLEIQNLNLITDALRAKVGDELMQLSEKSVDSKFTQYYRKLQLIKIDSLSKTEVSNLLKNLLLSLLISDYDSLPSNAVKYGKFLRIAINFLDSLHEKLYDNKDSIKPSFYLKDDSAGNIEDLSLCLNGMLHEIRL